MEFGKILYLYISYFISIIQNTILILDDEKNLISFLQHLNNNNLISKNIIPCIQISCLHFGVFPSCLLFQN